MREAAVISTSQRKARMRAGLHIAVISTSSTLMATWADAAEGEGRWRLLVGQDRASLVLAATDLGTDNYGSPLFSCKRASGTIQVGGEMDEKLRQAVADLIRSDTYPLVKFLPEDPNNPGGLILPSYSELNGSWEYNINLSADTQALNGFKRTGVFQFTIGATLISASRTKAGLENFDRFQNVCKRPPRSP
jgi:hypothetical protein